MRHPLFPTVAAFWFAALFGLGSLAVRTSLLESLVIASKIDLIVPQTAPPLGMTARILIALAMAAIGSILGFVLALRMARPKPEKQERVRTARGFGGSQRSSQASAFASDEPDERTAEPERRRSLIASNEGEESIFDDGPSFLTGMSPHILDVTKFDFDPIDQQPDEPEQAVQPQALAPALELDQFATVAPAPVQAPTPAPGFETFAAPQVQAEPAPAPEQPAPFAQPGPVPPETAPALHQAFSAPVEQEVQSFAAPAAAAPMAFSAPAMPVEAPHEEVSVSEPAPEAQVAVEIPAFVAPVTSPLQFNLGATLVPLREPSQPEAAVAPVEPVPVQEAFAESADSDDANPMAQLRNKIAPMPVFDVEPDVSYDIVPEEAAFHGELAADPEPAAEAEPVVLPGLTAEPPSVTTQLAVPMGAAAERLMNANLSDLSPVELIERLALSLQRRGQAVTLSRLTASEPVTAPAVTVQPEQIAAPVEAAAAPAEVPAAAIETEAHHRLALPAAMRPIDFSQYEHHDDDLPAYVPARSIAMPTPEAAEVSEQAGQAQPEEQAAPAVAPFGLPADEEEASALSEEEVLEAGYSSLLNMSRPAGQRPQFVRVIDPEAETEAVEPVVIFPGQAVRAGTKFAAPNEGPLVAPSAPPPSLAEMSSQNRRFDAPGAQGHSQPAPARSPEETERALRSALSTLQRMSGVA